MRVNVIRTGMLATFVVLSCMLGTMTAHAALREGQAPHDANIRFQFDMSLDWKYQPARSSQASGYVYTRTSKGETLKIRILSRKTSCDQRTKQCHGEFYDITGLAVGTNPSEPVNFKQSAAKFFGTRPYTVAKGRNSAHSCKKVSNTQMSCDTLYLAPNISELVHISYLRPVRLTGGLDFNRIFDTISVKDIRSGQPLPFGATTELPQY